MHPARFTRPPASPATHPLRMCVWLQDDDGRAWLLCASENNQVLHINELAPDYLSFLPGFTRALEGRAREAPAVFKHGVGVTQAGGRPLGPGWTFRLRARNGVLQFA